VSAPAGFLFLGVPERHALPEKTKLPKQIHCISIAIIVIIVIITNTVILYYLSYLIITITAIIIATKA